MHWVYAARVCTLNFRFFLRDNFVTSNKRQTTQPHNRCIGRGGLNEKKTGQNCGIDSIGI